MTNKSPAYRWYPRDILGSLRVSAMTAAEECWYRRALDFAWLNHGVPTDPIKLARIIGKKCTTKGAQIVLTMFTVSADNPEVCVSERQELERSKQKEWSEKSAKGGHNSRPPAKGSKSEPNVEPKSKQKRTLQFAYAEDSSNEESQKNEEAAKPAAPARKKPGTGHEKFIEALKVNPDYAHIDLDLELAKAEVWAGKKKRQFTQRFVTAWLDRIEKPLPSMNGGKTPGEPEYLTDDEKEAERQAYSRRLKLPTEADKPSPVVAATK